jgi:hypothetical protein
MASFIKEAMVEQLQQGKCEVFFKKTDGTIRQMICTLNPKNVPTFFKDKITESPQEQMQSIESTAISVWDLEKSGWRSFRINSILTFRLMTDISQIDNL